ncbi:nucleic acid-binding protein [Halorubrum sp. JWXQ-INN 858]|uniref:Zn-ribbon domain-containing OB-fold protein n=1 Tax=Halorubrum sp. JWXQ-INN 858 TaxID=2690782 RepID=UPI00135AD998|nr:OB-fold domain-containing protein [Halorubrum sp. JWXQ-INN 858]MWV65157.1 nucleic acid-binding protein [Halorubrum sp. JWXQ-INN 858]
MTGAAGDAGYDEWLAALADGQGFYLESPAGHGSLPPRRVCPHSGSTELTAEPLPEVGTLETFTVVHVPTPRFDDDAPYVTAIADFGAVRLTGVLRGVDPEAVDGIDLGMAVEAGVEERETDGKRIVVLRPA